LRVGGSILSDCFSVRIWVSNPIFQRGRKHHKLHPPRTTIAQPGFRFQRSLPRKQRHTAKRVFDRLRDERGFTGGYTIIKDYIREREQRRQEVFVPLSHAPGHGQADFGEAMVVIGGVERKAHFFVLDLPHSDGCYVRAYPAAVSEAWVDGQQGIEAARAPRPFRQDA
jgi:transposase